GRGGGGGGGGRGGEGGGEDYGGQGGGGASKGITGKNNRHPGHRQHGARMAAAGREPCRARRREGRPHRADGPAGNAARAREQGGRRLCHVAAVYNSGGGAGQRGDACERGE